MQKKLITDQLIEEYQKELKHLESVKKERIENGRSIESIECDEITINYFIKRLKSLRQQEVQNVMTAYRDGEVVCHLYKDSNDYFTSTFQQEKGEVNEK